MKCVFLIMLSKLLITGGILLSLLSIPAPKPKREPRFFSEYRLHSLFEPQKKENRPEEFKLDLKYQKGQRLKHYDLYELTD